MIKSLGSKFAVLILLVIVIVGYRFYSGKLTIAPKSIGASAFSEGRIAFVKGNDVWLATSDGNAKRITDAASVKTPSTYPLTLAYRLPRFSPDGKMLAFVQSANSTEQNKLVVYDGTKIREDASQYRMVWNAPPLWFSNSKILLYVAQDFPKTYQDANPAANFIFYTVTFMSNDFVGANEEASDPFFNFYSTFTTNGCGGGGRPEWSYLLSHNHAGGMDGIRGILFYIKKNNELVFSTGCEQELATSIHTGETTSGLFNPSMKADRSTNKGWDDISVPQELVLADSQNVIVGTINRNVTLFDIDSNITARLTATGKAYGPVFSKDEKTIYFADNLAGVPQLKSIGIDGKNEKILFEGKKIGAISNITQSPNSKEIAFTLISQDVLPDPDKGEWGGKASQAIYIMNADGSNARIFVADASEPTWSL